MLQAFFLSLNGVFYTRSGGEWSAIEQPSRDGLLTSASFAAFIGALLGCLTTSYLIALGMAPAIASALATTLLCGQVLVIRATRCVPDELFTAVYGGAFGGMTSVHWFANTASGPWFLQSNTLLVSLAMTCSLAFCIVAAFDGRTDRPFARGYGGRSGAIAAAACLVFVELASLAGADDRLFRAARAEAFDAVPTPAALTFVACLMGTFAVLLPLRGRRLKSPTTADRVFLSAAIALIGLTSLHLCGVGDAATLDAFYAGCFLGMSTPERMKGRIDAALAAVVLAALLVHVKRFLPGVGGSLGLGTFLTVAVFVTLSRVTDSMGLAFLDRKGVLNMKQSFAGDDVTVDMRAFESQPSPARRRARVTFKAVLACGALGCLVLPVLLARDGLGLSLAGFTQVAGDPAPVQAQPVSSESMAKPGDDASPPIMPTVEIDKADAKTTQNFSVADRGVDGQMESRADIKDRPDAVPPVTSEVAAAPPPPQAGISGTPAGEKGSNDKIFREFLRWRAARSTETAGPGQKPLKKKPNHSAQVVGPLAVAAPTVPARPGENRPHRALPSSGRQPVESSSRPVNARAP